VRASVLVGRAEETTALERAVADVEAGGGHALHVVGEPGAGKTALLRLAQQQLDLQRIPTRSTEVDDTDQRRSFSVMRALLPECSELDAADPIGQLLAEIERIARDSPAALLVDDIHWADPDSLDALAAAARRAAPLGVLVVTAGRHPRGGTPLHRYQSKVERLGTVTVLEPLSDDDLAALVRHSTDRDPGPRLRQLLKGTSGNPFFALELLHALENDGSLQVSGQLVEIRRSVEVPATLRARLGREAIAAAGDNSVLLRAVAVLPRGVTAEELAALLDRSLMQVLEDIVRLEEARVLAERGDQLVFRHDIIRQSVLEATPRSVVRALNRRAVAVLRDRHPGDLRIADCLLVGAEPADPADRHALIELGLSLRHRAPLAAIDLLTPALGHLPGDDPWSADVTLALGWALADTGRANEVGTLLDARFEQRAEPRPVEQLRYHALSLTGDLEAVLGRYSAPFETELDPSEIDVFLVDALCELAVLAVVGGRIERSRTLIDWVHGAPIAPSPIGQAHLHHAMAWLHGLAGAFEPALEAAQASMRLFEQEGSRRASRGRPVLATAIMLDALGRPDEAGQTLRDAGRSETMAWNRLLFHFASSLLLYRRGEWDDALAEVDAGIAGADETELRLATCWPYAVAVLIHTARGNLTTAKSWLSRSAHEVPSHSMGSEWLGYATAIVEEASGRPDQAAAIMRTVVEAIIAAPAPGLLLNLSADAARLAIATGDVELVDMLVHELSGMATRTESPVVHAQRDWLWGLQHRDPVAVGRVSAAFEALSRQAESGRAAHDAAVIAAVQGDEAGARGLARRAFQVYDRLGADQIHARLRSELAGRGLILRPRRQPARPSTGWESLTATEGKVVELVGAGLTNSEIAQRLFVSRRTIESHLARVYPKLGLGRRTELVAAVLSHAAEPGPAGSTVPAASSRVIDPIA
jgi:DNA-binding CsgD family transcriptional regulator